MAMLQRCFDCGVELDPLGAESVMEERQISGPSHNDVGTFAGDFALRLVHRDRLVCQEAKQDRRDRLRRQDQKNVAVWQEE